MDGLRSNFERKYHKIDGIGWEKRDLTRNRNREGGGAWSIIKKSSGPIFSICLHVSSFYACSISSGIFFFISCQINTYTYNNTWKQDIYVMI